MKKLTNAALLSYPLTYALGFHYCDRYVDSTKVANPDGRFYGVFGMINSYFR